MSRQYEVLILALAIFALSNIGGWYLLSNGELLKQLGFVQMTGYGIIVIGVFIAGYLINSSDRKERRSNSTRYARKQIN